MTSGKKRSLKRQSMFYGYKRVNRDYILRKIRPKYVGKIS